LGWAVRQLSSNSASVSTCESGKAVGLNRWKRAIITEPIPSAQQRAAPAEHENAGKPDAAMVGGDGLEPPTLSV